MNSQPIQTIYYRKQRRFLRYMAHLITGILIASVLWILANTYRDPSFLPILILYICVAVFNSTYYYAISDSCVIITAAGIEYRKPEYCIMAAWSQVTSVKRGGFSSILNVHALSLDKPTITYTKWFGTVYRLGLGPLMFHYVQKSIPFGKNVWEAEEELENEIRSRVPSLHFDTP